MRAEDNNHCNMTNNADKVCIYNNYVEEESEYKLMLHGKVQFCSCYSLEEGLHFEREVRNALQIVVNWQSNCVVVLLSLVIFATHSIHFINTLKKIQGMQSTTLQSKCSCCEELMR